MTRKKETYEEIQNAHGLTKMQQSKDSSTEILCPKCNCANDGAGIFCSECGTLLKEPVKCPKCGSAAQPRADICEVCGEWLLKGQCKFCYAPIDEDEGFCGECGNPVAGIKCHKCGNLSIFDFCKICGIPLSIQAKQMMQEAVKNPAIQDIASLIEQLADATEDSNAEPDPLKGNADEECKEPDEQTSKLKLYRESSNIGVKSEKPKTIHRALFTSDQKARISQLGQEVAEEEERRRIEEERRRKEEEERRRREEERRRREEEWRRQLEASRWQHERKLQEQFNDEMNMLKGKTFSSNQEARRYFMSIVASLPKDLATRLTNKGMAWRCNAYNCVHNSPSDCADPSRGGVWLIQ